MKRNHEDKPESTNADDGDREKSSSSFDRRAYSAVLRNVPRAVSLFGYFTALHEPRNETFGRLSCCLASDSGVQSCLVAQRALQNMREPRETS